MTKNIRSILALVLMSLFVVIAGLSISVKSEAACSHSSTKTTTTAATCTSAGKVVVSCRSCGKTIRTQTISSLGHSYTVTTKNPTCTSTGTKKCSRCSSTTSISSLGHSKSTRTTQPTCGANGKTETYCTRCSTVISTATIPATGNHTYTVTKAATCTTAGSKKCNNCAATATIPATGIHIEAERTTAPTCTASGKFEKYCKTCNKTISSTSIPATGHSFDITTHATCTTAGSKTCSKCGEAAIIPALGHKQNTRVRKEATCQEPGISQTYCTVCNVVLSEKPIATISHVEAYMTTKEATCTEEGVRVTYCLSCQTVLATDKLDKNQNHTNKKRIVHQEATCAEHGVDYIYCESCNTVLDVIITAITNNHEFEVTRKQTCTLDGAKKCKICSKTEVIPAAHETEIEREEPTCCNYGKEITKCIACGEVIREDLLAPTGEHVIDKYKPIHGTFTHKGKCLNPNCNESVIKTCDTYNATYYYVEYGDTLYMCRHSVCSVCNNAHNELLKACDLSNPVEDCQLQAAGLVVDVIGAFPVIGEAADLAEVAIDLAEYANGNVEALEFLYIWAAVNSLLDENANIGNSITKDISGQVVRDEVSEELNAFGNIYFDILNFGDITLDVTLVTDAPIIKKCDTADWYEQDVRDFEEMSQNSDPVNYASVEPY